MLIALIGIISIQSIWISNSIKEKKAEFTTHINDALNKVNYHIDEDEAVLFIKQQFGGVDSLMHDIIVEDKIIHEVRETEEDVVFINSEDGKENVVIINSDDEDTEQQIQITISDENHTIHRTHEHLLELEDEWHHKLEIKMEQVDSILEANEFLEENERENTRKHVTSVIKRFSYEHLLTGNLEDRISKEELEDKLQATLKEEGITSPFEYAVYNDSENEFEEAFISTGFDKDEKPLISKKLFPNDRSHNQAYMLQLQFENRSGFVWKEVQSMVLLSIAFTVLILICFSFSLYFIFKQKKISRVKNDFINNMTHELKTPLASISLAAASIKHPEVINKKEEVEHFLEVIENEKKRINSHIEKVLDIAALDSGELKLNREQTDLVQLVNNSIQNISLSLSEYKGTCSFNTEIESTSIQGDAFHLTNVFTNILDNSIKYRKENLAITISLVHKDNSYFISFSDNGIGMNKNTQKLAFDKFYRAESGNIHNSKGFGLGLSYVKSIIKAHKGNVTISSDIDKGTVITIEIPQQ